MPYLDSQEFELPELLKGLVERANSRVVKKTQTPPALPVTPPTRKRGRPPKVKHIEAQETSHSQKSVRLPTYKFLFFHDSLLVYNGIAHSVSVA